jgi:DNA-binding HxlR family transcriptional regulator
MKKIITQNQTKMEKYTNEELLEVLPSSVRETKELTSKQKVVLGQLIVYNGLEVVKKDGYFYRSNKDLCNDCEIQEKTLIAAVRKLESLGFIERKKGARTTGASEYRVNEKLIGDYCKTPIEDYSNDYSKQIVEMTDKIRELEITVKRLVERITVIEGKNYSTDTDIDKELDIEKEINNNILNNNSLYNNIEETFNSKELEIEESKENLTESQLVLDESLASVPIEELSQATLDADSTEVEETQTSTEDEQYQQWLQVLTPYLKELENVKTLVQLETIKNKLSQVGSDFLDNHEDTSPTVVERMNRTVGSALKGKKAKLIPNEMELSEYLSRQRNYGSL